MKKTRIRFIRLTRLNPVSWAAGGLTVLLSATLASTGLISSTSLPASSQTCVTASYVTKYISTRPRFRVDHSYARFTWQPRFCRQGSIWQVNGEPSIQGLGAGELLGVGLNLQAPEVGNNWIEYRGQVRSCLPLGAGYKGLSYTGVACYTAANVAIRATIVGGTTTYKFSVETTKPGKVDFGTSFQWTDRVV